MVELVLLFCDEEGFSTGNCSGYFTASDTGRGGRRTAERGGVEEAHPLRISNRSIGVRSLFNILDHFLVDGLVHITNLLLHNDRLVLFFVRDVAQIVLSLVHRLFSRDLYLEGFGLVLVVAVEVSTTKGEGSVQHYAQGAKKKLVHQNLSKT